MFSFRSLPLKRKLTLVVLLTSGAALFLACGAFVFNDLMAIRHHMVDEIKSEAETVAQRSIRRLDAQDRKSLEELLGTMRDDLDIVCAAVYGSDGKVWASYVRAEAERHRIPANPQPDVYQFEDGQLWVFRQITNGGRLLGTVYLRSDLSGLNSLALRHLATVAMVLMAALLLSLLLSSRLQRLVSDPFLQLTQVAHVVTQQKDFSVRAPKSTDDEVGQLIDAFTKCLSKFRNATRHCARPTTGWRSAFRSVRNCSSANWWSA